MICPHCGNSMMRMGAILRQKQWWKCKGCHTWKDSYAKDDYSEDEVSLEEESPASSDVQS